MQVEQMIERLIQQRNGLDIAIKVLQNNMETPTTAKKMVKRWTRKRSIWTKAMRLEKSRQMKAFFAAKRKAA